MMYQSILLLLCLVTVNYCEENVCRKVKDDCGTCITAGSDCAYCKDEDLGTNSYRCDTLKNLQDNKCKDLLVINGKVNPLEKKDFNSDPNSGPIIQVIPQKIQLNLRPDRTETFTLRIKPAENFPVDLYYLMDMSSSMEDDLEKLRTLGTDIADEIFKITKNYRLAFGSFVDKTVAPFIQLTKLNAPCTLSKDNKTNCEKTFGYRHVFDFDKDATKFESALQKQNISGNLDNPEGGFDALMQVAMCTKILKWKPADESRRIVVFATDAIPHIGGDGRIGGIITPNDGECHLSKVGDYLEYSKTNELDYPSLSLLKEKLDENDIIPIMAVTADVKMVYDKIAEDWSSVKAYTGTLEADSDNIVNLIRERIEEIVSTLKPSTEPEPQYLEGLIVKFRPSKCEPPALLNLDEGECSNIRAGGEYDFAVSVTAVNCEDVSKSRSFTIDTGFGKVEVDVTMICECDCEKDTNTPKPEPNSVKCTNEGTFKCGKCYCNPGRNGYKCECDSKTEADDSKCKQDNSTETACSGQGSCVCGECKCKPRDTEGELISGKFCECNNFGCDRTSDGKLCGGEGRGVCECGTCKCKEIYTGGNCGSLNCALARKNCLKDGVECSGTNGECECGQCVCKKGYGGAYCEDCVSCPSQCNLYKDCVHCVAFEKGELVDKGCAGCESLNIVIKNETDPACEYQDDICWYHFNIVKDLSGNETIEVRKEPRCLTFGTKKANILAIVLGIIGGLILLALILLLLWKLLITAYDNYEYQKFLKDNQNPNWANTNNPIYKPSQTNYQNPTYAGK